MYVLAKANNFDTTIEVALHELYVGAYGAMFQEYVQMKSALGIPVKPLEGIYEDIQQGNFECSFSETGASIYNGSTDDLTYWNIQEIPDKREDLT